jgi:hypothetical protein
MSVSSINYDEFARRVFEKFAYANATGIDTSALILHLLGMTSRMMRCMLADGNSCIGHNIREKPQSLRMARLEDR